MEYLKYKIDTRKLQSMLSQSKTLDEVLTILTDSGLIFKTMNGADPHTGSKMMYSSIECNEFSDFDKPRDKYIFGLPQKFVRWVLRRSKTGECKIEIALAEKTKSNQTETYIEPVEVSAEVSAKDSDVSHYFDAKLIDFTKEPNDIKVKYSSYVKVPTEILDEAKKEVMKGSKSNLTMFFSDSNIEFSGGVYNKQRIEVDIENYDNNHDCSDDRIKLKISKDYMFEVISGILEAKEVKIEYAPQKPIKINYEENGVFNEIVIAPFLEKD